MKPTKKPKSSRPRRRLTSHWQAWLWGASLVLLVAIVYWPTLDNGFILDDRIDIKDNLAIRSVQGLTDIWFKLGAVEQYYPLVYSTFWVEYHLWGLEWRGYHVVNLLLHAASAVLVWRLLVRLELKGAWLAAAIFAVHPVEVESVAWANELKNVLSCALALGSLLAYLRFSPPETPGPSAATSSAPRDALRYYALALGLYIAAILSKTVMVSVPAVLLVIYWWKRGRVTWRGAARLAPFFAVGVVMSGITVWMERTHVGGVGARGPEWDLPLVDRMLVAGRALWFYAGKLVWPHPLILFYPRWTIDARLGWQYLFPAAALAVLASLWWARKRIGRGPLAAVLIFAGVLGPGLGFFNVFFFRFTFVADHFQYHASIALIALAAAALVLVAGRLAKLARRFAPLAGAALLLPLAVVAQQKTHIYKDDKALAEDIVALDPQSWLAHHYLGACFQEQGKHEEALVHFRKAIEIREQLVRDHPAISDYQNEVAAYYVDVGLAQREMGRAADAEKSFRKAIEVREKLVRDHPASSDYQDGLAWCYSDLAYAQHKTGLPAEAEASHRKAIEIREKLARDNPTKSKYKSQIAASYADLGLLQRDMMRPAEAENSFRKAIETREELIRNEPAVAEYPASLAASYEDLAIAQQTRGRPAEAAASLGKAIEIREKLARDNPTISGYKNAVAASYVDLGILQRDMGRPVEAESSFRKAIEIRDLLVRDDPAASDYQDGLGWCYVHLVVAQYAAGRAGEAEVSCRKAIAIREKLARDHPAVDDYRHQLAVSYRDLGNLQRATGRVAEAVVAYGKAIELRKQLVRDDPTNVVYRSNLAGDLADREALEKQLEILRQGIDKTETPGAQYQGGLPPWAAGFAVEIAKRELARLSVPMRQE